MANTFKGAAVLWGTATTTGTISALGSVILTQSSDVSVEHQKEVVKDADGNTKQITYYDQSLKASMEFVPTTTATDAGSITISAMLTAGVTCALADTAFTPIAGTWLVEGCSLTRSNTKAVMAKVDLVRYLNNSIP
jgi:hypothetical protein